MRWEWMIRIAILSQTTSLNPCYNGMRWEYPGGYQDTLVIEVLILVIME